MHMLNLLKSALYFNTHLHFEFFFFWLHGDQQDYSDKTFYRWHSGNTSI